MKLNMEKAIQNLVDESGLSQYAIERQSGLSCGMLSKCKGRDDITLTTLARIADGIGWSVNQVIDAIDVESVKITKGK